MDTFLRIVSLQKASFHTLSTTLLFKASGTNVYDYKWYDCLKMILWNVEVKAKMGLSHQKMTVMCGRN